MDRVRLTKKIVDAATAGEGERFIWDEDLTGFGLRVRAGGSKTFVAQYRAGGGRSGASRRYTIGRYGVLTVEEARQEAKRILAAATQGHDPSGARQAKRHEMSVADLIDQFAARGSDHLKPRNRKWMLARLGHHVVPLLGRKKISDVCVTDVEQMWRDVRDGKTAKDVKAGPRARVIVKGGIGAATRAVRDLSAVFTFAIRQEWVTANPCAPVKTPADKRRTRYLTMDEIGRLGQALDALEIEGASPKAVAIMRLWALTGCRRDEIAGLKWADIDFRNRFIVIRQAVIRGEVGPTKNGRERKVPMTASFRSLSMMVNDVPAVGL